MLREAVNEAKLDPIWKYIPKDIKKEYQKIIPAVENWVDLMKYPYESGWFGHYGEKTGEAVLEFNIKTYLDYDTDEALAIIGSEDEADLYPYIDDYYNYEREDLEESLKSEFKIGTYGYEGRSGGYILLEDWEEYIFKGTGASVLSPWYDDNYGDEVEDAIEALENVEELIQDLTGIGPLGEGWDDALEDLREYINELDFDTGVKKGYPKIVQKNYDKLEKFIGNTVKNVEKGFVDYLKGIVEDA